MKRFLSGTLIGIAALSACTTTNTTSTTPDTPSVNSGESISVEPSLADISKANNTFAFDLYKMLRGSDENIFISPASITTALGLAYAGARDRTAVEMETVLHFDPERYDVHASLGELLNLVQIDEPGRTVSINNAIWVDHETVVEQPYSDLIETHYGAREKRVDFRTSDASREKARLEINGWVEEKTKDRIQNLLLPPDLNEKTRLTLVNTIYLKADWENQFTKEATQTRDFNLSSGQAVDIQSMTRTANYRHLKGSNFAALELPYVNDEYSMLVFLPDENSSLARFERGLSSKRLAGWSQKLRDTKAVEVSLQLPKTKLTQRFNLGDMLKQMGMETAFSDFADFTKMIDNAKQPPEDYLGIKLDDVIHKTFLEMDEKGTEAAAATAITMVIVTGGRVGPPPIKFHVDRPYFIVLKHNETDAILFMGRINDPR